ncbi:14823_t:CDS:2, partial [Acaulospora morrowiae]
MSSASSSLAPLIITSTSNLTPDKKWDLLFNVDHTLEIPMEKRPKIIRLAITSAVKEYTMLELSLGECTHELKCKEVANIKYKVRRLAETYFKRNPNLKLDILESGSYLTEQG